MTTAGDIYRALDAFAPFDTAESWDNVGLLAGSPEREVSTVVTALDITPATVDFAAAHHAELIVSHHPVIFSPLRRLEEGSAPWRLAASGIAAVCAHTNLDKAAGGVNDWLAARLRLSPAEIAGDGLCRVGTLPEAMEPERFAAYAGECLGCQVRFSPGVCRVRTAGVCSGAGGDCLSALWEKQHPDALLTGEIRHHEWLELTALGATVVEAGHYHTEIAAAQGLAERLSVRFPDICFMVAEEQPPYQVL
ncbi:MAG: Nif3-like dinuclear metal center hexameric protein [Clostridiales bacterium]|nr:Nif3-like dinuclear metal center hexameric protein [Clostridiales bacterium]